ncbi:hypothetical protein CHUAL_000001 [Chamberlinius hualienensis]
MLVLLFLTIFSVCVLSSEVALNDTKEDKFSLCLWCNGLNYYECCIKQATPGMCCPVTTTAAVTTTTAASG